MEYLGSNVSTSFSFKINAERISAKNTDVLKGILPPLVREPYIVFNNGSLMISYHANVSHAEDFILNAVREFEEFLQQQS
jgi:hypothetical protein